MKGDHGSVASLPRRTMGDCEPSKAVSGPLARCGGSRRTGIERASPSTDATTRRKSQSAHPASSSAPVKPSCSEPQTEMLFSCGDSSSTTVARKASTARSSGTKAGTSRRSLSDRLTASLITSGLVCGITPTSIRKLSGQPIRVLAFATLDGPGAAGPQGGCSSSKGSQTRPASDAEANSDRTKIPQGNQPHD